MRGPRLRSISGKTRLLIRAVLILNYAIANCVLPVISQAQANNDAISTESQKLTEKGNVSEVRELAARNLGRLGQHNKAAIQPLSQTLLDEREDRRVRRAAVSALTAIGRDPAGADAAISALIEALAIKSSSANDSIRALAARAVGRLLQNGQKANTEQIMNQALPVLLSAVVKPDSDPMVRANAAWAIGQLGSTIHDMKENDKGEIVNALIQAVKVTPTNVGETAGHSLIKLYKTAVPELIKELNSSDDANFRWSIAWILGVIGNDAEQALPSLTMLLEDEDEDPNVRGAAAWAIGKMGSDAKVGTSSFPETLSALTTVLDNTDNDPNIRANAAWAMGRLGPEVTAGNSRSREAVEKALGDAVTDVDPDIRRNAVWALGQIRPNAAIAVPRLTGALINDPDPKVRVEAAVALGLLGPPGGQLAVDVLRGALDDEDPTVRVFAARSLGQIGSSARGTIDLLLALSKSLGRTKSENAEDVRRAATKAIVDIANALQIEGNTSALEELQRVASEMKENGARQEAFQVRDDVDKLRTLRWFNRMKGILAWIQHYRLPALFISGYVLTWLLLYWKSPLLVFRINEAITPYIGHNLPGFMGGLPISYLIFGGIFHYRARVLDRWIAEYGAHARERFEKKILVEQRKVYVDVPALIDGKGFPALSAAALKACFEKKRTCVLICGEGGSGKTSLACQLCRWAMAEGSTARLHSHTMLPVLLEEGNLEIAAGENALIQAVRRELWYLTETDKPPSAELTHKLLESRRVLVVVDGLSEMNEAKQIAIRPARPDFLARDTVITSRLEMSPAGVDLTVVKPVRVQGDRLSTFMDAYLIQRDKKCLFTDAEYFDSLGKLSRMVGNREITVLLAKLYAEQMIAAKEVTFHDKLPENIPDLMLEYLNELNHKVSQDRLDDRVVHRMLKTIAWECLRETYRPAPAKIDKVLSVGNEGLRYLERNLRVLQTIGAGQDRIRFTLDPLAEYLAGLQAVEQFADADQQWRKFLAEADAIPGAPQTIVGFLLAIRDCCLAKGDTAGVPSFVVAEIGKRAGLNAPGEQQGKTAAA